MGMFFQGAAAASGFAYRQVVTVASASLTATLTDFPLLITEANVDAGIWTKAKSDGSDIVVTDSSGTRLETELVLYDPDNRMIRLYAKAPTLSHVSNTIVYLYYGNPDETITRTPANVWKSDFKSVVHLHGMPITSAAAALAESTGNANTFTYSPSATYPISQLGIAATSSDTGCHQGIAIRDGGYWGSDTNTLKRFNSSWVVQTTNANPCGATTNVTDHVGDIDVYNSVLYAPMETYLGASSTGMCIAEFNATTLAYITEHDLSAQGHEVSGLVVEASDNRVTVTSYHTNNKLYRYNLGTFAREADVTLSSTIPNIQGITRVGSYYYITSDVSGLRQIYQVGLTGTVIGVVYWHSSGDPNIEGLAYDETDLHVLTDGGGGSRFVRRLRPRDGRRFGGSQWVSAQMPTNYTSGTMRAWFSPEVAEQDGIVSLSVNGTGNDRSTLVAQSGTNLSTWDSNGGSWLNTGVNPTNHVWHGGYVKFATGGNRTVGHNGGATKATGSAGTIPSTRDTLFIGAGDTSPAEIFNGSIREIRFSSNQESDAWLAYEDKNVRDTANSYTVAAEEAGSWAV